MSNSILEIVCPRCGLHYKMKANTLDKRNERKHPNPKYCRDCLDVKQPDNSGIWERYQADLIANGSQLH